MAKFIARVVFCFASILALVFFIPFPVTNLSASPDLPMWGGFMHDASHSGRTNFRGCDYPQIKWVFETNNPITSTPVIDSEGNIYLLTTSGTLYSISPEGTERWRFESHMSDPLASFWVTPLIHPSLGEIYFGASNRFFTLSLDGRTTAAADLSNPVNGSPTLCFPGIVQPVKASRAFIFNPVEDLHHVLGDRSPLTGFTFPPASTPENPIILSYQDGMVVSFDLNLNPLWEFAAGGPVFSPSTDSDGIIYIHTNEKMISLRRDGSAKWSINFKATSLPGIGWSNTLYVGSSDKNFYALNPETGGTIWKFTEGNSLYSAPTIDIDEVIYFGSADGKLYALKSNGEKRWVFEAGSAITAPPSISEDGTIYFGTAEGTLYALEQGTPPTEPTTPSPTIPSFPDVPSSYWAYAGINLLASSGVINGYPDGTFKPELPVTRAEFAKMVVNSTMVMEPDLTAPSFPDVTPEHWAFEYIEAAAQNGFVKGYPDGTFKPEGNITIAEVLTVIVRVKNWTLVNPPGPPPWIFLSSPDGPTRLINVEDWFYQYVGASAANGLLLFPDYPQICQAGAGSGEYTVKFNSPATRAQTAVFLARAFFRL